MSDYAQKRAPSVDADGVFPARDKVVPEAQSSDADGEVGDFFPEDSLKTASTLPFVGPRQRRPEEPPKASAANVEAAKSHKLISISPSSIPAAEAEALAAEAEVLAADTDTASALAEENLSSSTSWRRPTATHVAIAVLSIVAIAEFTLLVRNRQSASVTPVTGTVAIESTPPGARVVIDGHDRGTAPLTLSLRPGEYEMSLTAGVNVRNVHLVVPQGNSSNQRFYFSDAGADSSAQSATTDNSALTAGHAALNGTAAAQIPHAPTPTPAIGAVGGWLTVDAPVDLQLFEAGAMIGSSQTDRIMLPVGRHTIEVTNAALGYKASTTVQVSAGSVTRFKPEMPNGTLNINAIPWAEVAIDGNKLGPTPLGDVSLPIGSHDVVFTHPQLGERHQTATVTLNGINRVSVNLNQR
jgi:hypothetical protein